MGFRHIGGVKRSAAAARYAFREWCYLTPNDDAGQFSPEQHTRSFRISEAAKEAALSIFSFAYVPPVVRGLPFAGLNSREPANGHTVIICQMLILLYLMYFNLFEGTFYHVRL